MPRYSKEQIDDVAGLLFARVAPVMKVPAARLAVDTITAICQDFADLFAADNPPVCRWCTAPVEPSPTNCPKSALGQHTYLGGFDRAEFLRACGIEP